LPASISPISVSSSGSLKLRHHCASSAAPGAALAIQPSASFVSGA